MDSITEARDRRWQLIVTMQRHLVITEMILSTPASSSACLAGYCWTVGDIPVTVSGARSAAFLHSRIWSYRPCDGIPVENRDSIV